MNNGGTAAAGVDVGDGQLHVELLRHVPTLGTMYKWEVWAAPLGKRTQLRKLIGSGDDLCLQFNPTPMHAIGVLAGFLTACGDALDYYVRTGEQGENYGLFNASVRAWAYRNVDELALAMSLAEINPPIGE